MEKKIQPIFYRKLLLGDAEETFPQEALDLQEAPRFLVARRPPKLHLRISKTQHYQERILPEGSTDHS